MDCLTQLICIGISLCQHTNRKDVAGKSANHYLDCLLDPHLLTLRCLRSLRWSHSFLQAHSNTHILIINRILITIIIDREGCNLQNL